MPPLTNNPPTTAGSANSNDQVTKYNPPVLPSPEVNTTREATLDKWVDEFSKFIQDSAKGNKPILVLFCDLHNNSTSLATQIQMLNKLSVGPFAGRGVNFYAELADNKLEEFKNRKLSERNTSTGSIVIPIADALNFKVIAADPYNSGQYSDIQMMGELFPRRDKAMANKIAIAEGNRNGIALVGASHAKGIATDPELHKKYTIIMIPAEPTLNRNECLTPYLQNACNWYNSPQHDENRMPSNAQGAYPKPEPWKLIQKVFTKDVQDKIASKLDPSCKDKEQLKRNLENYDSTLHLTFGNVYK